MTARFVLFRSQLPRKVRELSMNRRKEIAHTIATEAKSSAPVLTGRYQAGISVEVSGTQIMVVDTDDTAIHKEYGTSKAPAHAALTNAAMRYGTYSGTRPRRGRR
ncbi:hypothetical protein ACFLIN_03760 [Corynebacterium kutscheri]|uniref:hypothetical protein n=1 Tax=Corynebacterium kutscheri TaxID=35755 RepID=UPI0037BE2DB2